MNTRFASQALLALVFMKQSSIGNICHWYIVNHTGSHVEFFPTPQKPASHFPDDPSSCEQIISLHIRSMWETICDAWACWSGWNFGPNSTEYPYSEIQFQNTPSPENENCQRSWYFDFSVSEYPPSPKNWNLGRSWHFVTFQFQNTPPRKWKLSEILALWLFSFRIPPSPWKLKFRQILALCDFSVSEYPPTPEIEI